MQTPFSILLGRFLYRRVYWLYQPLYSAFKKHQDKNEIDLFNRLVKKGSTILDIGANIGFYSKLFSKLVGKSGGIIAFEPDRTNFQHLLSSIKSFPNIQSYEKAVSNRSETIRIYTSKLLNVDHRTYPIDDFESCYEIEAIALDDWLDKLPTVHLIKMDIQGYEPKAIEGMRKLLERDAPMMFVEFWPHGLRAAGTNPKDFIKQLTDLNYNISIEHDGDFINFQESIISELESKGIYGFTNLFLKKNNELMKKQAPSR